MLYLITYDLKSPGRDYSNLHNQIKNYGEWWHYIDSTWIIKTESTIEEVTNSIRRMMDPNDHLLVIKITKCERNGWLPKSAWDWISARDY